MGRARQTMCFIAACAVFGSSSVSADPLAAKSAEPAAPVRTPRCVGWAIAGAVGGMAAGYGLVAGGYAIAGQPIGDSAGDVALILSGEVLGMTFLPVATCQLSNEPYTVPAATFLIGGGSIGGTAVGVPLMLLILSRDGLLSPGAQAGDGAFFADILLYLLATTGGVILGGWGGLKLERWLRRDRAAKAFVAPGMGGGMTIGLRFVWD